MLFVTPNLDPSQKIALCFTQKQLSIPLKQVPTGNSMHGLTCMCLVLWEWERHSFPSEVTPQVPKCRSCCQCLLFAPRSHGHWWSEPVFVVGSGEWYIYHCCCDVDMFQSNMSVRQDGRYISVATRELEKPREPTQRPSVRCRLRHVTPEMVL